MAVLLSTVFIYTIHKTKSQGQVKLVCSYGQICFVRRINLRILGHILPEKAPTQLIILRHLLLDHSSCIKEKDRFSLARKTGNSKIKKKKSLLIFLKP